jgi:hypothetical protein
MRYILACLLGLGLAVGLGLLVAPLGDPFELFDADVGGAFLRSAASALHDIRVVVIDLINAFVRIYL